TNEWTPFILAERPELAERYFSVIETGDAQVAVVYLDGKLARVIGPAKRVLFWKGPVQVTADVFNARETPEVPERLVAALARIGRESLATFALIEEGKRGLVYLDGRLARELPAGTYAFWNAIAAPRIDVLEMRRQTVEVPGQEILTKDKVTLRVNVSAVYE